LSKSHNQPTMNPALRQAPFGAGNRFAASTRRPFVH
jgi:hypothetical protein